MAFPGGRLSVGTISQICNNGYSQPVVLQVLEVKKMVAAKSTAATGDRYRLTLSDSEHLIASMITTQLNNFVHDGSIQPRSVIRMTDYICNPVPGKNGATNKLIVIVDLEAVSEPLPGVIGAPVDITAGPAAVAQVAATMPSSNMAGSSTMNAAPMNAQRAMAAPQVDPTTGHTLTPVKMLDMFLPRWTIRVRCSVKSDLKEFNGERPGTLFSVTLLDESGEIRATMFNDAAQKFHPIFVVGGMYVISGGRLKSANKKFTSVKHAYELTLNSDATVIPIESVATVPHLHFDFVPIDNLQDSNKDDMVDVIGVVVSAKPSSVINTKRGEVQRRSLVLADQSNRSIELTLWGQQAVEFDNVLAENEHPVLAVKGARVSDFGGRTLSAVTSSEFEVNPDIESGTVVRNWWATVGDGGRSIPSLSSGAGGGSGGGAGGFGAREKTLAAIANESLGLSGQQQYLTVPNVTVTSFKKDGTLWYKACANPDCKGRKVYEEGENVKCQNCQGVNNFRLRWVSNFTAFDHTGREYVSGFGETGTTLIGSEAETIHQYQETGQTDSVQRAFEYARFKSYNMRLAVKSEEYNGNVRTKVSVQSLTPIDFVADSERLLQRIAELRR